MGLGKLGEKKDDPSHDRAQSHRAYTRISPVKKLLREFCRFVDLYPDISLVYSFAHSTSPPSPSGIPLREKHGFCLTLRRELYSTNAAKFELEGEFSWKSRFSFLSGKNYGSLLVNAFNGLLSLKEGIRSRTYVRTYQVVGASERLFFLNNAVNLQHLVSIFQVLSTFVPPVLCQGHSLTHFS